MMHSYAVLNSRQVGAAGEGISPKKKGQVPHLGEAERNHILCIMCMCLSLSDSYEVALLKCFAIWVTGIWCHFRNKISQF